MSAKYVTKETIRRAKQVSLLDHLEKHVPIVRKDGCYWAESPLVRHNKSPLDLKVDPKKMKFYCQSSGTGGDIIDFEMQLHGLPFVEAVESICLQHGLYVEYGRRRGFEHLYEDPEF